MKIEQGIAMIYMKIRNIQLQLQIRYKIKNTFGMLYLKENAYYKNIMIWLIVPQEVFFKSY